VAVTPVATTAERVDQEVVFVPMAQKRSLLTELLAAPAFERVLVFTRTKHGADRVVRHLVDCGVEALAIHGNKSQPQRERALAGFRGGQIRVLVATDIAARGIDVDSVSHVINFELPNVPEDYVHRIGRTARAGAAGSAISFCSDDERPYLRDIEKLTRLKLRVAPLPANLPAAAPAATTDSERPVNRRFNAAPRRPDNGRNDARRPDGGRHENGKNPNNRPGSPSPRPVPAGGRPVRASGQHPASANGQREPAGDAGGLPAFLRRDGDGGRPSRSQAPWRQNGRGRKPGGRATGSR
jgi:ATP-dependent RNA helicase RhlE